MIVFLLKVNIYIRSQSQYLREVNCICEKVRSQQVHKKSESIFERGQLRLLEGQKSIVTLKVKVNI